MYNNNVRVRSLSENHSAKAFRVHQLPVGLAVLHSRVFVDHHTGRVIVLVVQPPPPAVVAGDRRVHRSRLADILAGLVAVPDRARRRRQRRVFVAGPSRCRVQRVGAPVQPVRDAEPPAAGAVHCAGQQQRVGEKRRVRRAVGAQRPAHAELHAHDHQENPQTVEPVQPVQERRQEPVPDHRRAGQRPGDTAEAGLLVQAQQQGPEQGMEEEIRHAVRRRAAHVPSEPTREHIL